MHHEAQNYNSLVRKITTIYFSKLSFKTKNDCVCRLISDAFPNIAIGSILLYESKKDILINHGHYLNAQLIPELDCSLEYKVILYNISLYDYFFTCVDANTFNICSFKDFVQSEFFNSKLFFDGAVGVELNEEVFIITKKRFASSFCLPITFRQLCKHRTK